MKLGDFLWWAINGNFRATFSDEAATSIIVFSPISDYKSEFMKDSFLILVTGSYADIILYLLQSISLDELSVIFLFPEHKFDVLTLHLIFEQPISFSSKLLIFLFSSKQSVFNPFFAWVFDLE